MSNTTTQQAAQVFDVPQELLPAQLKKVELANRKAARAGLPGYTAAVVGDYRLPVLGVVYDPAKGRNVRGVVGYHTFAIVEVYGEAPKVPGWTFAGTVQWDAFAGALVNRVPGLPESIALPTPTTRGCDHCGAERRRKDTYMVLADSGELKQVGRNCLTAYTGIPVGWVSTSMGGVDEVEHDGTYVPDAYATDHVLDIAATMTRLHGWQPSSSTYGITTRSHVDNVLDARTTKWNAEDKELYTSRHTAEDSAQAVAALAWARSLPDTDDGTYLCNLHRVLAADWVTARNMGLAVSALQAHAKAQERDLVQRQAKADAQPVPVGDGIVLEGTIARLKWQEGYGYNSPSTLKARVQGAGWAVWVTVPGAHEESAATEQQVRFVANVTASPDDATFGFAKRPRKWEVLA